MTNSHLNITHKLSVSQCFVIPKLLLGGGNMCREKKSHSVSPHMAKIQ